METAEKLRLMLEEREKEAKQKAKELYRINQTANAEQLAKNVALLISSSLRAGISTAFGTAGLHAAFELYDRIDPAAIPDAGRFDELRRKVGGLKVVDRIIEKGRAAEHSLAVKALGEKIADDISSSLFGWEIICEDEIKLAQDALVGRKLTTMLKADNNDKLIDSFSDWVNIETTVEQVSAGIAGTLKMDELSDKSAKEIVEELDKPRNLALKLGFDIIEHSDVEKELAREEKKKKEPPAAGQPVKM